MTQHSFTLDQAFTLALAHHQAGRRGEAEPIYRRILAVNPNHSDAWHLLGVLACQNDQQGSAVEMISRAVALQPGNPVYHSNLGEAQRRLGRLDLAEQSFVRAQALDPTYADAYTNYGHLLSIQERFGALVALFEDAVRHLPGHALVRRFLGDALVKVKRLEAAAGEYRVAIQLDPSRAEAHVHLGLVMTSLGRPGEAAAAFRAALEAPGREVSAAEEMKARMLLGGALASMEAPENLAEAIAAFEAVIRQDPENAKAHAGLGQALRRADRLDEAVAAYRQALLLAPEDSITRASLAFALRDQARLDEAIALLREALVASPELAAVHSGLICTLMLHPRTAPAEIDLEQRRWNERFVEPLAELRRPHVNVRDPARRLRVGYVSADLRRHPVGRFMRTLLAAHDRTQVEVFCYSTTLAPDSFSAELQGLSDHWCAAGALDFDALAERIRADGIDILVDLSMHTVENRLPMFARKPAPIQMSYLGYCSGTGVAAMDYRLTDSFLDPMADAGGAAFDRPLRLESFWCYAAHPEAGGVYPATPLPALAKGHVTFGCLNYFSKVNDQVLAVWARLLERVRGSRLHLHVRGANRFEHVRGFFAARNIPEARLTLFPRTSAAEYFNAYSSIDIALDPFPFAGGTTTLDALYMGVPVITRALAPSFSRGGVSILSNLGGGAERWIADSDEAYVAIAAGLAEDMAGLPQVREALRGRLERSVLMDAPRFARQMESAFRRAWQGWCEGAV